MFLTDFLGCANYNTLAPQNAASETSTKKLGSIEIQTQGCWARRVNATFVLYNPCSFSYFNAQGLFCLSLMTMLQSKLDQL